MENSEKYALITGASSGIGWHFAELLAKKGYSIVAVSNQPSRLDDLKKKLGRMIPMLFDPSSDFENFRHPFILYDPKISFIGWLILMIIISPFLQLLATVYDNFFSNI